MEAVPRMPMLSFELKQSPEYVDFGPVLKQYIRDNYGEDPAQYNKACNDLEQLRQSAVHISHDFMGCSTLKKYYAQLQFLQGRFPMGEAGEAAIPFTWEDIHLGREITIGDAKFEQACILYNIGALHSILGTMETRQSADGMKVSCTHFQCASWAFEFLRDHFGCALMSADMSHDLLTFQMNLMLAQAQECILEKSMIDSRKCSITAKVAAQIVEFYRTALRNLDTCYNDGLISSRKNKEWKKRMDIKILFYQCITHYYMGRQAEEQQKAGENLAYYTAARDKLNECSKLAKNEGQDIQESLRFTNDVITAKFTQSKKDNDFVYHEKVPAMDTLPEVKGASLVKGIPFNPNDPEVSGPDIFQKLVPMKAHEASSLYSEEKARLLRKVGGDIEAKNDKLIQFMSSLQLDQAQLGNEQERLPQQLLEKCAAISVRTNAIKDLVDSMGAVSNVATEVDCAIREINHLLEEDAEADEEFEKQFGKRSPNILLPGIKKECDLYEEGHKKGSQSNSDLHRAMNAHVANLKLLSSPLDELQKALPSLDKEKNPEDDVVVKELQRLLSKVEEMKAQRTRLEEELRDQVKNDDITSVIVTQEETNKEKLFEEQLKKHEEKVTLINQNLSAQENILRALTDCNAKYASLRRTTVDTGARREGMIRDLINSYDVYEDLMAKSQKGLEFYRKLETNITRLLDRCRGLCKVQHEEREQIINRYKPKVAAPSRPMAPKPGKMDSPGPPDSVPSPISGGVPGQLGPVSMPQDNFPGQPSLPSSQPPPGSGMITGFEGPKLKDFLPFMKPKTFGKDSPSAKRNRTRDTDTSSLPGSVPDSPVHFPTGTGSLPGSPFQSLDMPGGYAPGAGEVDVKAAMLRGGASYRPDPRQSVIQRQDIRGYPSPAGSPGLQSPAHSPSPQPGYNPQTVPSTVQGVSQPQGMQQLPPNPTDTQRLQHIAHHPGGTQNLQHIPPHPGGTQEPQHIPHHPGGTQGPQHISPHPGSTQGPQHNPHHPGGMQGPSQVPVSGQYTSGESGVSQVPVSQHHQTGTGTNTVSTIHTPVISPANTSPSVHQHYRELPAQPTTSQHPGIPQQPPQQMSQQQLQQQQQIQQQQQLQLQQQRQQQQQLAQQLPQQQQNPQQQPQMMQQPFSVPQSVSQQQPVVRQQQLPQQQQQLPQQQQRLPQQQLPRQQLPQQQQQLPQQQFPQQQLPQQQQQFPQQQQQQQQQFPQQQVPQQQLPQQQPQQHIQQQQVAQQPHLDQQHRSTPTPPQQFSPHSVARRPGPMSAGGQVAPPQGYQTEVYPQGQSTGAAMYTQANKAHTSIAGSQSSQSGQQSWQQQQSPYQQTGRGYPVQQVSGTTPLPQQQQQPQQSQGQFLQQQVSQGQPTQQMYSSPNQATHYQQQMQGQQPGQQQQQQQLPGQPQYPGQQQGTTRQPVPNQMYQGQQLPGQQGTPQGVQQHGGQQMLGQVVGQQQVQHNTGQMMPGQNVPGRQSPMVTQQYGQPGRQSPMVTQQYGQPGTQQQYPVQPTNIQQSGPVQQGQRLAGQQGQGQILPGQQGQGQMMPVQQGQGQMMPGQQGQGQMMPGQQGPGQMMPGQQGPGQMQQGYQQVQGQQNYPQGHQGHYQGQQVVPQQQSALPRQQAPGSVQNQFSTPVLPSQAGGTFARPPHPYLNVGAGQPGATYGHGPVVSQNPLSPDVMQVSLPSPLQPMSSSLGPKPDATGKRESENIPASVAQLAKDLEAVDLSPSHKPHVTPQPVVNPPPQLVNKPPQVVRPTPTQPVHPIPGAVHPFPGAVNPAPPQTLPPSTQSSLPPTQTPAVQPGDPTVSRSQSKDISHQTHKRNLSVSSNTSLDDILSSSPTGRSNDVMTPKVLTAQEIQQQKEEALMKGNLARQMSRDPYSDMCARDKFVSETEKLAKFVEGLDKTTCSGPTQLDIAWKELIDEQEKEGRKLPMAIARCYTMKNRELDVMPYDETRVILTSHKDDYINASWINELSPSCPKFIATQTPLPSTVLDFWLMVYEQGVEVIVMLSSELETGKKYPDYWPLQKGQLVHQGPLTVTLQSVKDKQLWTERIMYLNHPEKRQGRTIVQLQYKNWPVSGFPEKVPYILQFITEVHSFYRQQRSLLKPVVVHCSTGIGRTGTFLMIYTCRQEIDHGNGIINIQDIAKKMLRRRRHAIREKSQLKFCYEATLYYAQDILAQRGILVHKASFGDKLPQPGEKNNQWTPTEDVVFGNLSFKTLQSNMARMGMNVDNIGEPMHEKVEFTKVREDRSGSLDKETKSMLSSLPDVVQRTDTSQLIEHVAEIDTPVQLKEKRVLKDAGFDSPTGSVEISRSSSEMSMRSNEGIPGHVLSDAGSGVVSLEGSPVHQGQEQEEEDSLPVSLADLQDPKTFTLGAATGKKKVTKASFMQSHSSLADSASDPSDPLSSLDPLWTINKQKK